MEKKEAKYILKNHSLGYPYKIGKVKRDFAGEVSPTYKKGQIVLYHDWGDGYLTVESPMSMEWIKKQEESGSGIFTVGTMVGVPRSYVK